MFAGHAALALLAKGARKRVPLAVLGVVAFAPDVIQRVFEVFDKHNRELSHSMVSVGIGATLVSLVYWIVTRRPTDAFAVWLTYASHWPADFITGLKPTWPGGPTMGLMLYFRPRQDFLLETAVVLICWVAYWRSLSPKGQTRPVTLAIPWILIALQYVFTYGLARGIPMQ